MKDLLWVDPKTGVATNYGVITKKRHVGEILVYLTYDETARMWWIAWHDEGAHRLGFIEARREACWEAFFEMTPDDLVKLRASCS